MIIKHSDPRGSFADVTFLQKLQEPKKSVGFKVPVHGTTYIKLSTKANKVFCLSERCSSLSATMDSFVDPYKPPDKRAFAKELCDNLVHSISIGHFTETSDYVPLRVPTNPSTQEDEQHQYIGGDP